MGRVNQTEKIGYFGGTFDPPHLGHIILAVEAYYQLQLDSLRWILTPDPPHKYFQPITPVETRLEMLSRVFQEYPIFELSRVDIDRDPPYFAADTAEILREQHPNTQLVYIIGEDSLHDLPKWIDPDRFLKYIDQLAVAPRPEITTDLNELEAVLPGILDKTRFLSKVTIQISSSLIRERIITNGPYKHFLSPPVAEFIEIENLYQ